MSSANIGWMFYKDYFIGIIVDDLPREDENSQAFEERMKNKYTYELRELGAEPYDKNQKVMWKQKKHCILYKNECLVKAKVEHITSQKPTVVEPGIPLGNIHFKATTTYPGLLLGSGNMHELPSIDGQAILGFHFDYTTGLPTIQGSSVKGLLRSAFKHEEYIKELLSETLKDIDIRALEKEIFGSRPKNDTPQMGNDIFFDVDIVHYSDKLLADDYLAPHGDDPLQEPNVLRFIKVAPEVTFLFNFELTDGLLKGDEKKDLFKQILEDLGVGAKTNVGYGQFSNFYTVMSEEEKEDEKRKQIEKAYNMVMNSANKEEIEYFIKSHPQHEKIQNIKDRLKEIDNLLEKQKAKDSFGKLDKTNKKYIESFIKSHENDDNYKELVEKAKKLLETSQQSSVSLKDILDEMKLVQIVKKLKIYIDSELSENEKNRLIEHIKRKEIDLGKKKKYPHTDMKKFLGETEGQELFESLIF